MDEMNKNLEQAITPPPTVDFNPNMSASQRFNSAQNDPSFHFNKYFGLSDAIQMSAERTPRDLGVGETAKQMTSDTETIILDTLEKSVINLSTLGDKAALTVGNVASTLTGGTIGKDLRDKAYDNIDKRMKDTDNIGLDADAETWAARITGGAFSMAELLAIGFATGGIGANIQIFTESMGEGAMNNMRRYADENGGSLEGFDGSISDLAIDTGNAIYQVLTEKYLGTGRFIRGTSGAFVHEALNGFLQESLQGAGADVAEILKGNEKWSILAENAEGYIKDGIVGGLLQGPLGAASHSYNKRKAKDNIRELATELNPTATQEQIEQKVDEVYDATETKRLQSFAKEMAITSDAINDIGVIRGKLETAITNSLSNTDMTESDKAQFVERYASAELDNVVIDSLEKKIPLSESAIYNMEVNDLGVLIGQEGGQTEQKIIDRFNEIGTQARDLATQKREAEESNNYILAEELDDKLQNIRRTAADEFQAIGKEIDESNRIGAQIAEGAIAARAAREATENRMLLREIRERQIEQQKADKIQDQRIAEVLDRELTGEQMASGREAAQGRRIAKETAIQTKEAIKRGKQEQRLLQRAIRNISQTMLSEKAKSAKADKKLFIDIAKQDIDSNAPIEKITEFLQGLGFPTRSMNNTEIRKKARKYADKWVLSDQYRDYYDRKRESDEHKIEARDLGASKRGVDLTENAIAKRFNKSVEEVNNLSDAEYRALAEQMAIEHGSAEQTAREDALLREYGYKPESMDVETRAQALVAVEQQEHARLEALGDIDYQSNTTGSKGDNYRSSYLARDNIILFGEMADESSLPHEFAHYWVNNNFKWYRSGQASTAFRERWSAVERYIGVKETDKFLSQRASEKFARAYEHFLGTEKMLKLYPGQADDGATEIKDTFLDFNSYIVDIYDSMNSAYFKEVGRLPNAVKAFFAKSQEYQGLDAMVKRGKISEAQARDIRIQDEASDVIESQFTTFENATNLTDGKLESDAPVQQITQPDGSIIVASPETVPSFADDTRFNTGEVIKSKTSQSMRARTEKAGIEGADKIQDTAHFRRERTERVIPAADALVANEPTVAWDIIAGRRAEQDGLFRQDLFRSMEARLQSNNDIQGLIQLNQYSRQIGGEAGSRLQALTQRPKYDFMGLLEAMDEKVRNKKRQKEINQWTAEMQEVIDQHAFGFSEKKDIEFFESVEC